MGYEMLSNNGLDQKGIILSNIHCIVYDCTCVRDYSCPIPNPDFKCTWNGGCAACDMLKSSRFNDF